MKAVPNRPSAGGEAGSPATSDHNPRFDRLIGQLPWRFPSTIRWLRQPSGSRVRVPSGVLLTCGGVFGFLPVLGFWMLPLGLALLADDVPALRSLRSRMLDCVARRRPHWFADPSPPAAR